MPRVGGPWHPGTAGRTAAHRKLPVRSPVAPPALPGTSRGADIARGQGRRMCRGSRHAPLRVRGPRTRVPRPGGDGPRCLPRPRGLSPNPMSSVRMPFTMSEEAEFPVADGSAPEPEVDSAVLGEEIARLREHSADLRERLHAHPAISLAQGVLMGRYRRLAPDVAFTLLREASQRFNIKLHMLADALVRTPRARTPGPSTRSGPGLGRCLLTPADRRPSTRRPVCTRRPPLSAERWPRDDASPAGRGSGGIRAGRNRGRSRRPARPQPSRGPRRRRTPSAAGPW
ncbi:ANTAR domain-containing protein [Streptomyces sp. 039-1]|uniref:ANTAR domain-containing protein n=1 Tax=Streptomyces sp. 039-1 TaxID=2789263 RepID=UPI0039F5D9DB